MPAKTATDADFDALTSTGKPTLVDFWATWCGPCKQVAPVIDAIADEHPEFEILKVDIDSAPAAAARFGVMSVPYFAIFDGHGNLVSEIRGPKPKQAFLDALGAV